MVVININEKNASQRVDKYLLRHLTSIKKSFLYKMFRKKNIRLNGKKIKGNEILKAGDQIKIFFSDETYNTFRQNKRKIDPFDLAIIYEDKNLIIMNKPFNLLSQPDGKNPNIVDKLYTYLVVDQVGDDHRFGLVNRLDKNTTGLIVAGKNVQALQALNKAITERQVKKIYHAIVYGIVDKEMVLEDYIIKDRKLNKVTISGKKIEKSKKIKTSIRPICSFDELTLLEIDLESGRTHQIRGHLASIGHYVIGDMKYGRQDIYEKYKKDLRVFYPLLHSFSWTINKIDQPLKYLENKTFTASYPKVFDQVIDKLTKKKYN